MATQKDPSIVGGAAHDIDREGRQVVECVGSNEGKVRKEDGDG